MEQLHSIKQQHDESFRGQETEIDELQASIRYKYLMYRSVYRMQMVIKSAINIIGML